MEKNNILEKTYFYTKTLFWILYIFVFFGVWAEAPEYLSMVQSMLKIVIGVILVYLFNPFTKTKFTNFHRQVVFSSGILLLLSSSLASFLKNLPIIKKFII
jgi:hypothetical protein